MQRELRTRRQFLTGIGLAAMAVGVAACSTATGSNTAPAAQATTAPAQASGSGSGNGSSAAAPAGAPADWSSVVAAAKKEGTLVLSLHAGLGYEQFAEIVKQALPDLNMQITNIKASDFAPKVVTEQQNGQFLWDVHYGPASNIYSVVTPAGGLQPIKPFLASLPTDATDNSKWAGGLDLYTDPNNPVTLITMLSESGGVYVNKDQVPEGISSPDDLVNPKYRGKIAIYNPTAVNGGSMSIASLEPVKGDDFMKQLILEQQPVFTSTSRQVTEFVAQGRYPIAFGVEDPYLAELQGQGVGKNVVRNRDFGTYVLATGASVLKNAPHPNATKVFLAWALSQPGQDAYAKVSSTDGNSRRVDVTVYHPDSTPDYAHIEKYKVIQGTASGVDPTNKTIDIAKQHP